MSDLDQILDYIGFEVRQQQRALYEQLCATTNVGTVVQAGTGTGKSLAVLAAAVTWRRSTSMPALIVTPTKALQNQYLNHDGPCVQEATGMVVRMLKGRNNYVCADAKAFDLSQSAPHWLGAEYDRVADSVDRWDESKDAPETAYGEWFGCPGLEECNKETFCGYRMARKAVEEADIIVTNTTLMIIDAQMKASGRVKVNEETGGAKGARIFPDYGVMFVDEAHELEGTMRDFATQALSLRTVESMGEAGEPLAELLKGSNSAVKDPTRIDPNRAKDALLALAQWKPSDGEKPSQRKVNAAQGAAKILSQHAGGWYEKNDIVLWFDPAQAPKSPRLVSTTITLSGAARAILTAQPFALVSGTIPKTMRGALGISRAAYYDVGHPFNYRKQAAMSFSKHSGSFAKVTDDTKMARAREVLQLVKDSNGGALLLFSAFSDLEFVHKAIASGLHQAGLRVLVQDREGDTVPLGAAFKADGNAVLFGSSTFATGFDVPGDALRLVVVWKAPYPGLDPVTRAIMAKSRDRYEDMMLTKVAQAAGRLIRTTEDRGRVHYADVRLKAKILLTKDPMVMHLKDYKLLGDSL